MGAINVQICPETGICSIIKDDGSKIDLMPDEVTEVRNAKSNSDAVRRTLAEADARFAEGLDSKELAQISFKLA